MQTPGSDNPSRRRRISVKAEDLEELYLLVQGAPYANTVLDAKAKLAQQELEATRELLTSARERYQQSNRRILRQDSDAAKGESKEDRQQTLRLKQKQDRCQSVLEAFDDVVAILNKMIKLRAGAKRVADTPAKITTTTAQLLEQGSRFRVEFETAHSTRVQLAVIRRFFDVKRVMSPQDIVADDLYFLRGKEHTYLIQMRDVRAELSELPVRLALSGQQMQPIARSKFLEMGQRKSLVRLVPKGDEQAEDAAEMQQVLEDSIQSGGRAKSQEAELLDAGSFSQLHDAAKRSGLVPNADLIAHVRDREFRQGDWQKAFQSIEGLFGKFTAAATQRDQRLRREDVDIASGKVRMSPKALMEKRARDIAETQRVDRARNRFLRVLEALRVMMRND